MAIYVVFTMGRSWTSKIILWGTRAKIAISHSMFTMDMAIIPEVNMIRSFTVGAEAEGVRWIPAQTFRKKNQWKAVYRIQAEGEDKSALANALTWMEETYSDAKYDGAGAIAIGVMNRLRRLWHWFGRWWRSHLSKNAVICTELVLRTLQKMNWLAELDPELTEAPKLLLALNSQKDKFKLVYATDDVKTYLASQS